MSQVASGWHYFRDSKSAEGLYDLAADPAEGGILANSSDARCAIGAFRRSILKVLTDEPVPIGAEPEELRQYRNSLESVIPASALRRRSEGLAEDRRAEAGPAHGGSAPRIETLRSSGRSCSSSHSTRLVRL